MMADFLFYLSYNYLSGFLVFLVLALFTTLALVRALAREYSPLVARLHPNSTSEITIKAEITWFCLIVLIFVLNIFIKWKSDGSSLFALGHLIPSQDAVHYFQCARQILDGGRLLDFCERRPFPVVVLSSLFAVAQRNLDGTILLQGAYIGSASYFLFRETWRQFGIATSALILALLYAYYDVFSTTVLNEPFGFALGILALTMILRCCSFRNFILLFFCLFFIALALHSRSGAFFVLPLLLIWSFVTFDSRKRQRVLAVFVGVVAIICATSISVLTNYLYGVHIWELHSNFAFHLYGLATGGKSSMQIMTDYPDLGKMEELDYEKTKELYRITLSMIMDSPAVFAVAMGKAFNKYFFSEFSYAHFGVFTQPIVWTLWIVGMGMAGWRRQDRRYGAVLYFVGGNLVSAPLISVDGSLRVYAATVCGSAIAAGLGFRFVLAWLDGRKSQELLADGRCECMPVGALTFATTMTVVALFLPLVVREFDPLQPVAAGVSCPHDQDAVVVRLGRESPYLHLSGSKESSFLAQVVGRDRFVSILDRINEDKQKVSWSSLAAGATLIDGYQRLGGSFGRRFNILWYTDFPPKDGSTIQFCVVRSAEGAVRSFHRASSAKLLD